MVTSTIFYGKHEQFTGKSPFFMEKSPFFNGNIHRFRLGHFGKGMPWDAKGQRCHGDAHLLSDRDPG